MISPCFLLPASCSLLPASCSPLPASRSPLPASCFLLPAPCFLLPFLLPFLVAASGCRFWLPFCAAKSRMIIFCRIKTNHKSRLSKHSGFVSSRERISNPFTAETGHSPVKEGTQRKTRADRGIGRLVIDRPWMDAARVLSPCPSLSASVFASVFSP